MRESNFAALLAPLGTRPTGGRRGDARTRGAGPPGARALGARGGRHGDAREPDQDAGPRVRRDARGARRRASAESTYGSLLSFGKSGTAVGVADLVDRATLDREFLGDNDVLVVAVTCDEPEAEPVAPPTPGAALRCVPAMNVGPD